MRGDAKVIGQMLNGADTKFIIPVYQRNYDWKIENCAQLFTDLENMILTKRPRHFFGCIVSQISTEAFGNRILIDGQQRITTCFLLLFALVHSVEKGILKTNDPVFARRILDQYLLNQYNKEQEKLRLKLIKKDQEAFFRIAHGDFDNLIDSSNVTVNYKYFAERIAQSGFSPEELEKAIMKLEVIDITLDDCDDPQLIFESLNSTGLNLSEGDKIRNYLLMRLSPEEQEMCHERYWEKIEERTDFNVSDFVRSYLTTKIRQSPPKARIYAQYKTFFEKSDFSQEEHLADLLEYAGLYQALKHAELGCQAINLIQRRLNLFEQDVIVPFLLGLYKYRKDGFISDDETASVLKTIETYLFRRFVCREPSNALAKVFMTLHSEASKLSRDSSYLSVVNYLLLHKEGSAAFPNDHAFETAFKERDFYQIQSMKYYFFDRLENEDSRERVEVVQRLRDGTYSIEHIMPQTLSNPWREALGPNFNEIHENWLHKVANLTLTAYNSEYSNRSFLEKRDAEGGFCQSGFRINDFVRNQERWGEEELEARNELLWEKALRLWPLPSSEYVPPATAYDEISLDEDERSVTNRKIAAFTFMGSRYTVSSWREMHTSVISLINTIEPAILTSLTEEDGWPGSHFLKEPQVDYRQISDNLYVWIAGDTRLKLCLLKALFDRCHIPYSELSFDIYRKPSTEDNATEA